MSFQPAQRREPWWPSSPEITYTVKDGGGRTVGSSLWRFAVFLFAPSLIPWKVDVPPADTAEHSHPPGCVGTHTAPTSHPGQAETLPIIKRDSHELTDRHMWVTYPPTHRSVPPWDLPGSISVQNPHPSPVQSLQKEKETWGHGMCDV